MPSGWQQLVDRARSGEAASACPPTGGYRGGVQGDAILAERGRRIGLWARPHAAMIWGGVWLVYLLPAFTEAVHPRHTLAVNVVTFALLVTFVLVYLFAMRQAWDRDEATDIRAPRFSERLESERVMTLAVLAGIAIVTTVLIGEAAVACFVFLAPVCASLLPPRWALRGIGLAVVAAVVGELVARRYGADTANAGDVLGTAFGTAMAGLITLGIRRMQGVMWELEVARRDVERLATAQERTRIARDLHDVLGHSLTVISVKSQLAGRLIERGDVDRAGTEIREVEVLSRDAMNDVREAVAGYRARTLAAELAAAEATLDGAGIAVTVERSADTVPPAGEEALGFVVREGVTNVLRHSRARRCDIHVVHTGEAVIVELIDDGGGTGRLFQEIDPAVDDPPGDGNGLRGLAERVSAVGGRLSAGDRPDGGFVLRAEVAR